MQPAEIPWSGYVGVRSFRVSCEETTADGQSSAGRVVSYTTVFGVRLRHQLSPTLRPT